MKKFILVFVILLLLIIVFLLLKGPVLFRIGYSQHFVGLESGEFVLLNPIRSRKNEKFLSKIYNKITNCTNPDEFQKKSSKMWRY